MAELGTCSRLAVRARTLIAVTIVRRIGESDEVPFSVPDDLSDLEKQIVERSKQLGLVPYNTPGRERDDPEDAVAESSELSPYPDLWRLDNTDCFVPNECHCCRDMGPKLTRIQCQGCITTHEEFPLVCLNLVMLRLAYFELHDRRFPIHHDMHRLLEQLDLTFEDAVQTALAMEAAKKDVGEICLASSSSNAFTTHCVRHWRETSRATAAEIDTLHPAASM
ncbi:hypothetical protein HPB47_001896 [Ixodes persulcatus]|uniref:Uncharacterized protein n=1 Tax=Ixodes persulcatus TaxID=34615 RepID=A0AC60PMV1_IXOPE|nr:hypothetical protein HPB47_001896 [Ixodes persulcatus]